MFIKINGELYSFWLAVKQNGDEIDILMQKQKDKSVAMRFFKRLLKGQGLLPLEQNIIVYSAIEPFLSGCEYIASKI